MSLQKMWLTGDLSTWMEFDFDEVSVDSRVRDARSSKGALGHWVVIKDGKVKNYQAIVPSTWNAGPRDADGKLGAYEASLIGTK